MVKEKQTLTMIAISTIINELKIAVCIKKYNDIIKSARDEVRKEDELYSLHFLLDKSTNF